MYRHNAVSLIELILAVVILGIVAAVTIPRFSSAAPAPDPSGQLRTDLKILRVAIARYHQDHNAFPGAHADGQHPGGTEAGLLAQLTLYTDEAGRVSETLDVTHRFGPYLRDGLPPCPVAPRPGVTGVEVVDSGSWSRLLAAEPVKAGPAEGGAGWVYNYESGQIAPLSQSTDSAGRQYCLY
jgi:prepilin-type N-terminal cleavage/methylation domain-containing protein